MTMFFRKPPITSVVVCGLLFVIVAAYVPSGLARDKSHSTLAVVALYPDAGPKRVAADLTPKITGVLSGIPGVSVVDSASRDGASVVSLERENGQRFSRADRSAILAALKAARPSMPKAMLAPILDDGGNGDIVVVALTRPFASGPGDPSDLAPIARRLQRRIQVIAGIERVVIDGIPDRFIRVRISPEMVERHKIDAKSVSSALSAGLPAFGDARRLPSRQGLAFAIRPDKIDPNDIASVPIAIDRAGAVVRLRDIATIVLASTGSSEDWVAIRDRPAVLVVIRPVKGAAAKGWGARVQRVVDRFAVPRLVGRKILYQPRP